METNSLTFPNLEKALNDFISDFINTYKGLNQLKLILNQVNIQAQYLWLIIGNI